jgi:glycosyltransferase involved in cell wall biosynthesis
MRIALITDAWKPQVNGVVRTLTTLDDRLRSLGHLVKVIQPGLFTSIPMPGYAEIRLSVWPDGKVRRLLDAFEPEHIHIATEGPLGLAARRYCTARKLQFTTSFHTRFPEYLKARLPFLPIGPGYAAMRWFHGGAARTLVSNPDLIEELHGRSFGNLVLWRRGVDTELFRPMEKGCLAGPRPIFLYMGRVAPEKNIEDFLRLDLPGTKYVVGDGPARAELEARYPAARFTGVQTGEALVRHLASADCFVFPSRTDTLGLVMMEALACGVPVAAYPVVGPTALIRNGENGYLDEDLAQAALQCLDIAPEHCRASAMGWSLQRSVEEFMGHLVPARLPLPFTLFEGFPLDGGRR